MSGRRYLSGAAKRKLKKQRTDRESKCRRTLEDFGWKQNSIKKANPDHDLMNNSNSESDYSTDLNESSFDTSDDQTPDCQTQNDMTPVSCDPSTWNELTGDERNAIVMKGPPPNPFVYPRDSSRHRFPLNIFYRTLLNGQKVPRDWLVWSRLVKGLFCFSCCVMKGSNVVNHDSMLTKQDLGIRDNWRKLYEKIHSHEHNPAHLNLYCEWKGLEESLRKHSGIDSGLQNQIETEVRKWHEILGCILDVTLFMSERSLSFRGSSSRIGNPDNGQFLGTLELLSKQNKTLEAHLQDVRKHQESNSRLQAHYLSWYSQNEFIDECAKLVTQVIVKEIQTAFYYGIIVDGTPDVSHTEQITFVIRYIHHHS